MPHTRTSHVTCTPKVQHTSGDSPRDIEFIASHTQMSHEIHTEQSRHTHEWVTSHTRMSHVIGTNESRHEPKCVMPHRNASCPIKSLSPAHTQVSPAAYLNEPCHKSWKKFVASHIWIRKKIRRVAHMDPKNSSRHTYGSEKKFVASHIRIRKKFRRIAHTDPKKIRRVAHTDPKKISSRCTYGWVMTPLWQVTPHTRTSDVTCTPKVQYTSGDSSRHIEFIASHIRTSHNTYTEKSRWTHERVIPRIHQ